LGTSRRIIKNKEKEESRERRIILHFKLSLMLIKLKLKRNKYVEITPENLVDLKELLCVKDYIYAESWDKTNTYGVKKGQTYKFRRRDYKYGSNPKIGESFELRNIDYWHYFRLDKKEDIECFRGKLIKRRKKKDENKVENKAIETNSEQVLISE
jgi:hypothetical protein